MLTALPFSRPQSVAPGGIHFSSAPTDDVNSSLSASEAKFSNVHDIFATKPILRKSVSKQLLRKVIPAINALTGTQQGERSGRETREAHELLQLVRENRVRSVVATITSKKDNASLADTLRAGIQAQNSRKVTS